jgi:hypothetical protein
LAAGGVPGVLHAASVTAPAASADEIRDRAMGVSFGEGPQFTRPGRLCRRGLKITRFLYTIPKEVP